jgi:hypothetical protein
VQDRDTFFDETVIQTFLIRSRFFHPGVCLHAAEAASS